MTGSTLSLPVETWVPCACAHAQICHWYLKQTETVERLLKALAALVAFGPGSCRIEASGFRMAVAVRQEFRDSICFVWELRSAAYG